MATAAPRCAKKFSPASAPAWSASTCSPCSTASSGGRTTGFTVRSPDGKLDTVKLRHAAGALLQLGVRELVVIHFPEGAFARTRLGEDFWQPALKLPPRYIAGTAGAGDAFCTGMLWGLHEGWELKRGLLTGVCLAAASLSDPTCTAGIGPLVKSLALAKKFGFQPAIEKY